MGHNLTAEVSLPPQHVGSLCDPAILEHAETSDTDHRVSCLYGGVARAGGVHQPGALQRADCAPQLLPLGRQRLRGGLCLRAPPAAVSTYQLPLLVLAEQQSLCVATLHVLLSFCTYGVLARHLVI